MLVWLITIVVGAMLAPHVLKMGLAVSGSQWKLPEEYSWAPYVVGAIFNGLTILAFAILFLAKPFLTKLVKSYKNMES